MSNFDKLTNLGHLYDLGTRVATAIQPLSGAFKSAKVDGNTIKFYTTENGSGTPAFSFSLGEEQFLDQTGTSFVDEFHFSEEKYPGATDPGEEYEGKPVLVMGLKATENGKSTTKYVFANLAKMIKTYDSADKSITFNQFDASVNLSKASGNILKLNADGLYVQKTETAILGAEKDNIAVFNSDGTIRDTGLSVATDEEVKSELDKVFGTSTSND